MNCTIRGVEGKRGLRASGEKRLEEGINPGLKETYIALSRAAPPRDHERPAGVIYVDR